MTSNSKQQFWLDHLNAWRLSGLKNDEYCSKHGLNINLFSYWKSKFYKSNPELKKNTHNDIPVFVPISVVPDKATTLESGINIQLSNDLKITLSKNFDEATLGRLIALVTKINV